MATRKTSLPTPLACAFGPTGQMSPCCGLVLSEGCRGLLCPWASATAKGRQCDRQLPTP